MLHSIVLVSCSGARIGRTQRYTASRPTPRSVLLYGPGLRLLRSTRLSLAFASPQSTMRQLTLPWDSSNYRAWSQAQFSILHGTRVGSAHSWTRSWIGHPAARFVRTTSCVSRSGQPLECVHSPGLEPSLNEHAFNVRAVKQKCVLAGVSRGGTLVSQRGLTCVGFRFASMRATGG